ncbi:PAS domain S-box protein [Methanocalculus taiwanensis]|uniref:histidine kinase n=1 Tax=Methanocalculus taiwanensis TaxID=106207 RepID=A0ABD4TP82_9EURY|nr:PAS domain S-box protein [Methanocalculus taiwanensis]MCQ1539568.1 PAS domain S-box protein [Methanocalculus taiwanensis]
MPDSGTSDQQISLLYVDDELPLLEIGKLFLEKSGEFSVSTCDSAKEAIELLNYQDFDAIVSDYQMPGMDGLHFLQHLRKAGNQTPFIIFTGKGREEVVIEALNSGADFYLQKGGDPKSQFAELSNKIMYAVARRRSEMKLAHTFDLMRYIIEHNNASIAVHDMDMNYIFVSQRYLETYGITNQDVIGRNHYDIFPDLPEKWRDIHRKVLAGEGVFRADDDPYPRKDGSLDWTRWECRPWFESDGTIGGLIVYTEIITERKLKEEEILSKNEELAAAEEELRSQLEELIATRDALEESNEYLNNLITYANAPIIVWDSDHTITRINHAFEDLTGISSDKIIGKDIRTLLPEESCNEWMTMIDRAMSGDHLESVEIPIMHCSGGMRNVIWNSATIMDHDGLTLLSVIAQGQDITDQKAAEENIRKYLRREADIINFLPDATFAIDTRGVVIAWNRAMEEMSGVPAEDMLGRGNYEYALPFYHERRPLLIDLALLDDPEIASKYPYVKRIGDTVFSEITIPHLRGGEGAALWFKASLLYDDDGNVTGAIESIRDITERKQLEDKNRIIAGMLDVAPSSITIHDNEGNFLYANQKTFEIHGYTKEEFFEKNLADIDAPSSAARIEERMQLIAREGEASFEVAHLKKDGSIIPLEIFVRQVEWAGKPAMLSIATDITERKVSEAALLESESRFRELAELLPQAVYETDEFGTLTYANRKAFEMFGYSQEEVDSGLNVLTTIDSEYREKAKENLIKVVKGNRLDGPIREYRAVRKDGTTFPINIYSAQIQKDGRLAGVRGIIIDITEQKKLEEELQRSRNRYRSLVSNVPGVVYRCQLDKEWTMLYLNEDIEQITGYPSTDFIKNAVRTFESIIHPEDSAYVERSVNEAVREKKSWAIEYRIINRGGDIRWVYENGRAAIDGYAETGVLDGIIIDITDKKEAEEIVKREQGFIKTLLETSPAFFVAIGEDGKILKMNSALLEALECEEEDLIGTDYLTSIVPQDEHTYLTGILSRILHSEETTINQNHIISRTGRHLLIEWHGRRAYSGETASPFIVGVGIDITERKRAEDALREANRKLNLLSSITRHDILNKIMTIKGYLEVSEEIEKEQSLSEYIDQIKVAAHAIEKQIEFTRHYEQLGVHEPEWTSIAGLIKEIDDSGLQIACDCESVEIYADPMIGKVFLNLYDNSIRYAEGATSISLRCLENTLGLQITWEDDGPGIPYDQKELIFESGYGKHTGFGLFLVREILEITGITISETGVPGEGARFEIMVPQRGFRIRP